MDKYNIQDVICHLPKNCMIEVNKYYYELDINKENYTDNQIWNKLCERFHYLKNYEEGYSK